MSREESNKLKYTIALIAEFDTVLGLDLINAAQKLLDDLAIEKPVLQIVLGDDVCADLNALCASTDLLIVGFVDAECKAEACRFFGICRADRRAAVCRKILCRAALKMGRCA